MFKVTWIFLISLTNYFMTQNVVYLCKCSLCTWKECVFCYCTRGYSILTTVKLSGLMAYSALAEPPYRRSWRGVGSTPGKNATESLHFYSIFSSFSSINTLYIVVCLWTTATVQKWLFLSIQFCSALWLLFGERICQVPHSAKARSQCWPMVF